MKIHHIPLFCLYPVLRLKSKLISSNTRNSPRLRVLLYHDIAPNDVRNFAKQMRWLSKRWTFLSPEQFGAILTGDASLNSDSLLLTFDDGFKSNLIVAESVLNQMNIQAIFFVVPRFVSLSSRLNARQFIAQNIYPNLSESNLPEYWTNMTWDDLRTLLNQGHTIGSHTLSHARLSQIDSNALEYEINESAVLLEDQLNMSIEHFAYPFGDIASLSEEALVIATRRFKFVYSGLRGNNIPKNGHKFVIHRDSLSPSDPCCLAGSFLEGSADFQYKKSRFILDSWASTLSFSLGKSTSSIGVNC